VRPRDRVWAENRGSAGRVEGAPRRELPIGKTLSPRSAAAEPSSPGAGRRGLGLTDHRRLTPIGHPATLPGLGELARPAGAGRRWRSGWRSCRRGRRGQRAVGSAGGTPAPLSSVLWGQLHSARGSANRWIILCRIAEFRRRRSAVRAFQVAEAGDPSGLRPHGRADVQGLSTIVLGVKPRTARPGADPSPNPTADSAGAGKDFGASGFSVGLRVVIRRSRGMIPGCVTPSCTGICWVWSPLGR